MQKRNKQIIKNQNECPDELLKTSFNMLYQYNLTYLFGHILIGIESIYKQRCELIRTLANNENIPNLVLFDITRYNSDVFSSDELDDFNDKLMMIMSDEEIAIVDIQNTKAQEELDEYLLDMKIKGNRNYSGDYDYIDNEER